MQSLFNILAMIVRCSRVGGAAFTAQLRKEGKYIVPFVKEVKAAYQQSEMPHEFKTWGEWVEMENRDQPAWVPALKAELGLEDANVPEMFPEEEFLLTNGTLVTALRNADDQLMGLKFKPSLSLGATGTSLSILGIASSQKGFNEYMAVLRKVTPKGTAEQRLLEELEEENIAHWKGR